MWKADKKKDGPVAKPSTFGKSPGLAGRGRQDGPPGRRQIKQRPQPKKEVSHTRREQLDDLERRRLLLETAGSIARTALERTKKLDEAAGLPILDDACIRTAQHLRAVFDGGSSLPRADLAALERESDFAWDWGHLLIKQRGDASSSSELRAQLRQHVILMQGTWRPGKTDEKARAQTNASLSVSPADRKSRLLLSAKRIQREIRSKLDGAREALAGPKRVQHAKTIHHLAHWVTQQLQFLQSELLPGVGTISGQVVFEVESMSAEARRLERWAAHSDKVRKQPAAIRAMMSTANAIRRNVGLEPLTEYQRPNTDVMKQVAHKKKNVLDSYNAVLSQQKEGAKLVRNASGAKDKEASFTDSVLGGRSSSRFHWGSAGSEERRD